MNTARHQKGFTIVELLIVIVVIGILAAITIVAYNGIQDRAKSAAITSELSSNAKKIMNFATLNGGSQPQTTLEVLPGAANGLNVNPDPYRAIIYCRNNSSFAIGAETTTGARYSVSPSGAVVRNDALDIYSCSAMGVSGTIWGSAPVANQTPLVFPSTSCANQGANCTFTGTAIIAYGNQTAGGYSIKNNMTSPVACGDGAFGDPSYGNAKKCWILATY